MVLVSFFVKLFRIVIVYDKTYNYIGNKYTNARLYSNNHFVGNVSVLLSIKKTCTEWFLYNYGKTIIGHMKLEFRNWFNRKNW